MFSEKWSNATANCAINVYICFHFCQLLLHIFERLLVFTSIFEITMFSFSWWILCVSTKGSLALLLMPLAAVGIVWY